MSVADPNDDNVFLENNGSDNGLALIREIFDGTDDLMDTELERALENRMQTIVIEGRRLGEETARWISIGNCLYNTSILTGIGSIITGILWPDKRTTQCCLTGISLFTNGIHVLSWQMDECYHYRVENDPNSIPVPLADFDQPVVLTRRPYNQIKRDNIFQTAISLIALAFTAFKIYKSFNLTKIVV
ncbi:transmembrane protein 11 homolog, mitochondrial-like [Oppia nitens]|uniref:transmembrane protein 11 homolog, mitochondrial-like n=1 Tax=Oppia nitens TaxID=1686743 RepID=UPI0023DB5820|nr:transmembrane protein 11 homolog, mitochondrial-like [Oppia nitens]